MKIKLRGKGLSKHGLNTVTNFCINNIMVFVKK